MSKTMITRIQESKKATNIYLTNEVAKHLAKRLNDQVDRKSGVRIVILNKPDNPDIQVSSYAVKQKKKV